MRRSSEIAVPGTIRRRFVTFAALEFWGRFALTGVKSLLVLTLMDSVLAGDPARVIGAPEVAALSSRLFGPISSTALASQLYGYANALIYLSMPVGGLMGDLLGRRGGMVVGGAIAMVFGLFVMMGERFFLVGLMPFAIGAGVLKGNLSAQVGSLFSDEAERRRGFTTYLACLNAGVICGPLVCGTIAAYFGPFPAFAAATLAILLGLVPYVRSGGVLDPEQDRGEEHPSRSGGRSAISLLIVALSATYLCYAAYDQVGDIFLIWARENVDLRLGSAEMPVGWFLSLDGAVTLSLIALMQAVFGMLDRRGRSVSAVCQILVGAACCAIGYCVLAFADASAGGARVALPWSLLYLLLVDTAVVLVWPSGLSLVATLAPRRLLGTWNGIFYLHGFVASLWVGFSGVLYERWSTGQFWLLHAAMAAMGALLVLLFGLPLWRAWLTRQATTTSA